MIGPALHRKVRINIRYAQAEQFRTGITQQAAGLLVDVLKTRRVIYQKGGLVSVVQSETQQGDFLLCLFACGPGTQGDDAERQVARQFLKQPNLFRRKSVGLCGINVKTAEGVGMFVLERQGDGGTKTVLQSDLPSRSRLEAPLRNP